MGSLTPGATYIYESPDNGITIYAKEVGSSQRKLIGKHMDQDNLRESLQNGQLWWEIRTMAETHPALQKAMENVIIIYKIIKDTNYE